MRQADTVVVMLATIKLWLALVMMLLLSGEPGISNTFDKKSDDERV